LIKSKLGISVFSAMTSCCHLLQLQYQHAPLRVLSALYEASSIEKDRFWATSLVSVIPCQKKSGHRWYFWVRWSVAVIVFVNKSRQAYW